MIARPGSKALVGQEVRGQLGLPEDFSLRLEVAHSPLIEIASRDLRRRVAEGHSIRYQVPRAVEVYVQEKRLYRVGG